MGRFDRSSNPAMKSDYFERSYSETTSAMTVQGSVNKTFILLAILVAFASFTWKMGLEGGNVQSLVMVGVIGGLITALITIFSPASAAFSAPIYAGFEGLALGGISAMFNVAYPGIAVNAILLTLATLFGMLTLYKLRIIRATERFKSVMFTAMIGLLFGMLFSFILSIFGFMSPFYSNGPVGIVLTLVMAIVAAFTLILDFDMIEKGAENGAPKHLEWYGAFSIMVTLVWLYLEILRLLAMFQSRD